MSEVVLPDGSCSAVNYYKEGSCSPVCYCAAREFPLTSYKVTVLRQAWTGGAMDSSEQRVIPLLGLAAEIADAEGKEPWDRQEVPQPARRTERVGRNDPCPCGSGKKFKRCHHKAR